MPQSAHLRSQDIRSLFQLVGECRDLGDDPIAWRQHWFRGLARLTGAGLALGGEMAGHRAGRPVLVHTVSWGWENGFDPEAVAQGIASFKDDPTCSVLMDRYVERFRRDDGLAAARSDLIDDRDWYHSVDYQVLARGTGVNHSIWCFRSLSPGAEDVCNGVNLWRADGERAFSARDLALLREAQAAITPLIGGPLARANEPSPTALAPRVRQVLACLLEGDSDKQIAKRLGISRFTVNQYVKTIFQHFGVQSRPELLARWIRRAHRGRFPWADALAGGEKVAGTDSADSPSARNSCPS